MSATDTPPPAAASVAHSVEEVETLLQTGYGAIERRDLGAALDLFQRALEAAPERAECLHGMGVIALLLEKVDRARQFLEAAAVQGTNTLEPASLGTVYADLGQAYLAGGSLVHAVKAWQRAYSLSHDPVVRQWVDDMLHEQFVTALHLFTSGDVERATALCSAIVELEPEHARALHLLGAIAASNGALDAAETLLRRSLDHEPEATDTLTDLAKVLCRRGRFEAAIDLAERIFRLDPDHAQATLVIGTALAELRRYAEAEPYLRRAVKALPDSADAHCKLGLVLGRTGSRTESRKHIERAAELGGARHEAAFLLGQIAMDEGGPDAATGYYERQIVEDAGNALAHTGRGLALEARGHDAMAIPSYLQALQLNPAGTQAGLRIGYHFAKQGAYEAATAVYQQLLLHRPDDAVTRVRDAMLLPVIHASTDTMKTARARYAEKIEALTTSDVRLRPWELRELPPPFYLCYQGENDRDLQTKLASFFRRACPEVAFTSAHVDKPRTHAKIRVGILSAHLGAHSIGTLNRGFVQKLDRKRFEVVVIHTADALNDATTKAIDAAADRTLRLPPDFTEAQSRLAQLGLDVLFFTDIGMDSTSYYLALGRYARVQAVTWGHPVTTGIPNVDWFVSGATIEPDNASEHYSERVELLPMMPTWYPRPEAPAPGGRAALGLPDDRRVYTCPQSLFKLHPDFDFVLDAILRADPKALAVLIGDEDKPATKLVKARLQATLGARASRIRWLSRMSGQSYLSLLASSDVVLDPLHFGGGTTAFQCFAMGTPIVTLPSPYMRSRASLACYTQMGFTDLVARDDDHYVALALRLANEPGFALPYRDAIVEAGSRLFERDDAVAALGDFFERALQAR